MYSILFHLCGISILEICFFFYYIGPIETEMFKHHVQLLMKEPLQYLNNIHQYSTPMPVISDPTLSMYNKYNNNNNNNDNNNLSIDIRTIFLQYEQNNSNMNDTLLQNKNDSELRREKQNFELFIKTVDYWCILVIFSLIIFIFQYKYEEYQKLQKKHGLTIIDNAPNNGELELIGLQSNYNESYRKGSIDESDDETNIILGVKSDDNSTSIDHKNTYYYRNKIIHYTTFGSLVILFQYLFFQYIVYYYTPLTIGEIKYMMYQDLLPTIEPEL